MVERDQPAEDRLLPDRQADAVPVLQGERGLLVGEAELLGAWPDSTMSPVVAPGLTSAIASSMYSRQRTYASRIAGDALPTAKQR